MYAAKQAGRNQVAFASPLRDMGLNAAAWSPATDAESARAGNGSHPAAPQPAAAPLGNSPLSSHQVVLVQTEQTAASLCLRR
jgi:hypothetical protein